MAAPARLTAPGAAPSSSLARARRAALGGSFALLVAVGVLGESAAKPALGPRGWAPGSLPWEPSSATVTVLLVTAYLLGAAAVALGLLRPADAGPWRWRTVLALAALALLTSPFGSADHTNYAAYGRIAAQGGDPYVVPPEDWAGGRDPVTSAVQPPWTETVSVYGPLATLLQALTSVLGGDSMRQTVWVWQLVTVLAWLAVRAVLTRVASDLVRVDVLWTGNPLVFGIGVLGAHLDLVAAALTLAALAVMGRSALLSGLLVGLAASTKVTYALAAAAVLLGWAGCLERSRPGSGAATVAALLAAGRRLAGRTVLFVTGVLAAVVPLHLWAGPHVFEQLERARRAVSLATPWRLPVDWLAGVLPSQDVRAAVGALSTVVFVVFVVLLWRLTSGRAPRTAVGQGSRWALVLGTAYAMAAPYSLPWYDQLSWATLPLLAAGPVDLILLGRLAVMALAYVPGRVVALAPQVEDVTLGFRRRVAPYALLGLWLALVLAALRASPPRSEPRPPGPAR